MDKEQARFLLTGYRPDGADSDDPDFAAALALAARDRELGDWLAEERAFDACFAEALSAVSFPAGLREKILAGPAPEHGAMPQGGGREDSGMIGALAAVSPPEYLRPRVLAAMGATRVTDISPVRRAWWKRAMWPVSVAAGVALALFLTKGDPPPSAPASAISLPRVEAGFVRTVSAPDFCLEKRQDDPLALIAELKARGLPCPCCLPKGLSNAEAVGCREIDIEGKHGSLLCFRLPDGKLVHLLSFRREDISCRLPSHDRPKFVRKGNWSVAKWATDERVFMLMGEMEESRLGEVF